MRAALALVLVAACGASDAPAGKPLAPAAPAPISARLPSTPGAFAPSLVALGGERGSGGELSDGNTLSDVDTCSTCHPAAAAQWNQSPHSFASFGNPIYRFDVELARTELGNHDSQMCGGCHDMPLMADGLMAATVPSDDLRAHSGVTCRLCHGIQSVSKDGNGSYVWSRARGAADAPDMKDPASIARHREQVSVKKLGTELCVGCHRGFLSADMDMPVHLTGLDEPGMWRNSAYTGNGIARIDSVEKKTCIDCHMEREAAPADEVAAHDGKIASHRFLGGHTWMAAMRGDDDELHRLQAKLLGIASIDVQPAPVAGNVFDVTIRNLLVGHRFPGGVLDIQDTWIEVELADATGKRLAESGLQHATDPKDEDAHVLRTLVVDDTGHVLEHHEMPRMRTQIATQTLAPREAQTIRYAFDVPEGAVFPLTVTARLRHRSRTLAMQDEVCTASKSQTGRAFLDGAKGTRQVHLDPCKAQPITLIAETHATLGAIPRDWEREYEHGMALTNTVSERLEEARTVLEGALAIAPPGPAGNKPHAMILVQLAEVASKQGRADDALALAEQARALLPAPGPAVLDMVEADALMRVWRWQDATAPAMALAKKAPQNSAVWVMAARCFGSVGDDARALVAATTGLELAPRDPDLLRSQATALAAMHRPEADAALAAYDRFRSPDNSAELRISCASDSPRCAREREYGHTHHLRAVR